MSEGSWFCADGEQRDRGQPPPECGLPFGCDPFGRRRIGLVPPPLSIVMLEVQDDATSVAVAQLKALMEAPELPLGAELCLAVSGKRKDEVTTKEAQEQY